MKLLFVVSILCLSFSYAHCQEASSETKKSKSNSYSKDYLKGYRKGASDSVKELKIGATAPCDEFGLREIKEIGVEFELNEEIQDSGFDPNMIYYVEEKLKSAGLKIIQEGSESTAGGNLLIEVKGLRINDSLGYQISIGSQFIQPAHLLRHSGNAKFHFYTSPAITWKSRDFRKFSLNPSNETRKAIDEQLEEFIALWKAANSN